MIEINRKRLNLQKFRFVYCIIQLAYYVFEYSNLIIHHTTWYHYEGCIDEVIEGNISG